MSGAGAFGPLDAAVRRWSHALEQVDKPSLLRGRIG